MNEWKEIPINKIKNFKIGHAQDFENATGCSVIICEKGAPCGVDIRGGGPASRETDLLKPTASNNGIHGLLLGGGSAYGLDAAAGIMQYLEERKIGVRVGNAIVPIVSGSCIFDLGLVNDKVRPDKAMGYEACIDSEKNEIKEGNIGAGTGATVGKMLGVTRSMKTGIGTFAVQVGRLQVGAIVVVNAIGDVYALDSNNRLAGLLNKEQTEMISSEIEAVKLLQIKSLFTSNTTIGAIITNAKLNKTQMNKVAALASNGIARTIRPVNTSMDGDSIYALSCGRVKSSDDVVGTLGAYVLGKAIEKAVLNAEPMYGLKAAKDFL
ncbi:MAG: P1 family peptidase [Erysipelotrichales bacterium]|nr:P1 family peptidase [Erysipelotrichales bacterium]